MPIDNEIYKAGGDTWWDDTQFLSMLRTALNPARFGYFRQVLDRLKIDPSGKKTLDIGCGGGLLAEEFARLGCDVTGVDPSEPAIRVAREHAVRSGLDIKYRKAYGESLPFSDGAFDLVYCCDVLEHVESVDRVIAETSRVLKRGGLFMYDTLNRTPLSWLVMIKIAQDWSFSSFMEPNLHDWGMFIRPTELQGVLMRYGLSNGDIAGFGPGVSPIRMIELSRRQKRGEITFGEMGRLTSFKRVKSTAIMYGGYAVLRITDTIDHSYLA
ncbi:MAG: bifunctional 2-polyprenyl-6-hydroxyphenol methylase/3-demethylubiquinol 3-O-methyltransferase UbiG [Chloroflexota bacterium]